MGRAILGRSGGNLMVRVVQALMVMTMQGCHANPASPEIAETMTILEAIFFGGDGLCQSCVLGDDHHDLPPRDEQVELEFCGLGPQLWSCLR